MKTLALIFMATCAICASLIVIVWSISVVVNIVKKLID